MTVFDYIFLSLLFMYYFWVRHWMANKLKAIEEIEEQAHVIVIIQRDSERLVTCLARKIESLESRVETTEKNALWTQ